MKLRLAIILCLIGSYAGAESSSLSLALPGAPNSYQSDKFRAGELDCSNAIGSATNLEFGVTGLISEPDNFASVNNYINGGKTRDVGVYARITIPLGKRPSNRIDCNALFELEMKRKRLEIMRLEQELRQLRQLEFE